MQALLTVLKPEIKVLAALLYGRPKRFSKLRDETGLSDPWLSRTLRKLVESAFVAFDGKRYSLGPEGLGLRDLIRKPAVYSHFLAEKAVRIAEELATKSGIVAIVLFGTIARLEADLNSDLDLLIVTDADSEDVGRAVIDLEVKYDVPIEALIVSLEEFKGGLRAEFDIIFGMLAGYSVLVDKDGKVSELLSEKRRDVMKAYTLDKRAMLWLKR